ncbi:transposase domain-containing protein [Streptomyces sp. NBC_01390]|uniref:transposase domain-containing protein n=1 Tax=Streptomyces sp. NBC_01390 TaxID=2903850 RepID=UPI003252E03D
MKDLGGERLSDRLAVRILTWAFPPDVIERAVRATGRMGVRNRLLPPLVTVYYVLALCLFPNEAYGEVARLLSRGLALSEFQEPLNLTAVPTTAAISRARARLGVEPLKALFAETSGRPPAQDTAPPGARYGRWRLWVLDGRAVEVPDTPENVAAYGEVPAGSSDAAEAASPRIRVTVLTEGGTGTLVDADITPVARGVPDIAAALVRRLQPGDLLLADAEYARPELWPAGVATGADLLWNLPAAATPSSGDLLPDDSYIGAAPGPRTGTGPGLVRVVGESADGSRRLVTTVLDARAAPAAELRAVHADRWLYDEAVAQLAAFRGSRKKVMRSRSPEMIEQELWAHLLVYKAVHNLVNDRIS